MFVSTFWTSSHILGRLLQWLLLRVPWCWIQRLFKIRLSVFFIYAWSATETAQSKNKQLPEVSTSFKVLTFLAHTHSIPRNSSKITSSVARYLQIWARQEWSQSSLTSPPQRPGLCLTLGCSLNQHPDVLKCRMLLDICWDLRLGVSAKRQTEKSLFAENGRIRGRVFLDCALRMKKKQAF